MNQPKRFLNVLLALLFFSWAAIFFIGLLSYLSLLLNGLGDIFHESAVLVMLQYFIIFLAASLSSFFTSLIFTLNRKEINYIISFFILFIFLYSLGIYQDGANRFVVLIMPASFFLGCLIFFRPRKILVEENPKI